PAAAEGPESAPRASRGESAGRLDEDLLAERERELDELLAEREVRVGAHGDPFAVVLHAVPGGAHEGEAPGPEDAVDLVEGERRLGDVLERRDREDVPEARVEEGERRGRP